MDDERAETVREWDSRSAGQGHAGVRQLSDEGFSGAVEAGRTTALLTNGRIVWISGGDVDDLDGASLTAYAAPDDALPLLFAMQERGGETRAQYYTEDTPISEVNRTLEEGGFTGYVELSENVLSGDYYVVYHGGRSSGLAFVGNNRRLLTGDEAFERADDEVGIYEVVDATVEVIDLPGEGEAPPDRDSSPDETARAGTTADEGKRVADDDGSATDEATAADADDVDDAGDAGATAGPGGGDTGREDTGREPYGDEEIRVGAGLGTPGDDGDSSGSDAGVGTGTDAPDATTDAGDSDIAPAEAIEETGGAAEQDSAVGDRASAASESGEDAAETGRAGPAGTETDDAGDPTGSGDDPDLASDRTRGSDAGGTDDGPTAAGTTAGASTGRVADLEEARDRLEAELADAREALERVRAERDEHRDEAERLRERVEELESEVEELESEVEELESEVEELESEAEAVENADGPSLSPTEAIEGTNLFVRYRSKGEPTLEAAAGRGQTDREAVNDNLRIELHTTFETGGATVEDRPYGAFLEDTLAYRFVQWVVRDLLYELEATGNRQEMGDLYDAIPEIDRIELGGEVRVGGSGDDADDVREFDVVFRNRMSAPLAVADLHDGREPASGELVGTLIDDAKAVAGDEEAIGGAFAVTTSYYEPPAHEAADAATGGGFLSRSNRKSYVKLDRNHGFHLCLVEARDGEFNLNVPEL